MTYHPHFGISSGELRDGRKTAIRVERLRLAQRAWGVWAQWADDAQERDYARAKADRCHRSMRVHQADYAREYDAFMYSQPGGRFDLPFDGTLGKVSDFAATRMPIAAAKRAASRAAYDAAASSAAVVEVAPAKRTKRVKVEYEDVIRDILAATTDRSVAKQARLILRGNVATATQVLAFIEEYGSRGE